MFSLVAFQQHNYELKGQITWPNDANEHTYRVNVYAVDFFGNRHPVGEILQTPEKLVEPYTLDFSYTQLSVPCRKLNLELELETLHYHLGPKIRTFAERQVLDKTSIASDVSQVTINAPINLLAKRVETTPLPVFAHWLSFDYLWHFASAGFTEVTKATVAVVFQKFLTIPTLQRLHDSIGTTYPKIKPTEAALFNELLNGVCSIDPVENTHKKVVWKCDWTDTTPKNGHSLPNITVIAKKDARSGLELDAIEIHFPEREPVLYTKADFVADQEKFHLAFFITVSTFALKWEMKEHLQTHLVALIFIQGFFKTLSKDNPFYTLLRPHFGRTEFIDFLGRGFIFGSLGVLSQSALSSDQIGKQMAQIVLENVDWTAIQEKTVISDDHIKARDWNRYLKIVREWYDLKFDKILDQCRANPRFLKEMKAWSDFCQANAEGFPAFLENDGDLTASDINQLKKFAVWAMKKVTFDHWIAHSKQGPLTDLMTASLAYRNFAEDGQGHLAPGGNTTILDGINQLTVANTLLNFMTDTLGNSQDISMQCFFINRWFALKHEEGAVTSVDVTKIFMDIDI